MIRPLLGKIIVKQIKATTTSGIIIPDNVTQDKRGVVVAVSEGEILDGKIVPINIAIDDIVIWFDYAGHPFTYEGEEYIVLRQSDIIGVVPPKSRLIS